MNIGTSVIILMFIISYGLWLIDGLDTPFTLLIGSFDQPDLSTLKTAVLICIGLGIASFGAGLFSFPNQYSVFSSIAIFFVGFFTLPIDVFTATTLPMELKVFLGVIFGLLYLIAIISWYKGGTEP